MLKLLKQAVKPGDLVDGYPEPLRQDLQNVVLSEDGYFINGFLQPLGRSFFLSQQQNALGYNLSMQGIGDVAIDGPRVQVFTGVSQGFCCWVAQLG